MATGRTVLKHSRVYVDGYDLSGDTRTFGPLSIEFDEADNGTTLTDAVKGAYPGQSNIMVGAINTVMDNTDDGEHEALAGTEDAVIDCMFPIGIRAAPTEGDWCFCAQALHKHYMAEIADGVVTATAETGMWDRRGDTLAYPYAWGHVIHAKGAETGANSSGTANYDYGSQTTAGGYMMYHVFSSNGTVDVKVQDSSTEVDGDYSDLLTTGDVDASSAPVSGVEALGTGATVERYLRWQIALNTATTVTFAIGFVRG
jgi:hypothetical protein